MVSGSSTQPGWRAGAGEGVDACVLIVDDDQRTAQLTHQVLGGRGRILVASAREALEVADAHLPDLVIVSANTRHAFWACERLRQHPVVGQRPMAMVADRWDHGVLVLHQAKGVRADHYLTYPLSVDALRGALADAVAEPEPEPEPVAEALADEAADEEREGGGFVAFLHSELQQSRAAVTQREQQLEELLASHERTSGRLARVQADLADALAERDVLASQLVRRGDEVARLGEVEGAREAAEQRAEALELELARRAAEAGELAERLTETRDAQTATAARTHDLERQLLEARSAEEQLDALSSDLAAARQELEARDERLGALQGELTARDEQLHALRDDLTARDEQLGGLRSELAARCEQVDALGTDVAARDERAAALEEELRGRDARLTTLEAQGVERSARVSALEAELQERAQQHHSALAQ